jgi:hypothetical protein
MFRFSNFVFISPAARLAVLMCVLFFLIPLSAAEEPSSKDDSVKIRSFEPGADKRPWRVLPAGQSEIQTLLLTRARGSGKPIPEIPAGEPARVVGEISRDGRHPVAVPVDFPETATLYKLSWMGPESESASLAYDVFAPSGAPADAYIQCAFFVMTKDGEWFQAPCTVADIDPKQDGFRTSRFLARGAWNRIEVSLEPFATDLRPSDGFSLWQNVKRWDVEAIGIRFYADKAWNGEVLVDRLEIRKPQRGAEAAPLRILNFEPGPARAVPYETYEISFELNRDFADPFDPESIAVSAVFKQPDIGTETVRGFVYQDFSRDEYRGTDRLVPVGATCWKIRYTPRQTGDYTYSIMVSGKGFQTVRTAPRSFVAAVPEQGAPIARFIRVSTSDPHYFETDDGAIFYPIGLNVRSPNDARCARICGYSITPDRGLYAYEDYFRKLAAAGGNTAEVWMSNWWVSIEWNRDWEGFHGLGIYNLSNAWKLDALLALAKKYGIRIHLVIDNHGKYSLFSDPEWESSPYNLAANCYDRKKNGDVPPWARFMGWLAQPGQFYTDTAARALTRRRLQYIMARWGGDPSVLGFELISEVDLTGPNGFYGQGGANSVLEWQREMTDVIHREVPYPRVITTHYSGDYEKVDPRMAGAAFMDYIAGDGYRGGGRPFHDITAATAQHLAHFQKPFWITEFGGDWNGTTPEGLRADLHSGLWSGWMTEACGTPLFWWFDFVDRTDPHKSFDPEGRDLYWNFRALANFTKGEDKRGRGLQRLDRLPVTGAANCEAMVFASAREAYAWVYDHGCSQRMAKLTDRPLVKGARIRLPLTDGERFRVEIWDTYFKARPVAIYNVDAEAGGIDIPLPDFEGDVAIKVKPAPVERRRQDESGPGGTHGTSTMQPPQSAPQETTTGPSRGR